MTTRTHLVRDCPKTPDSVSEMSEMCSIGLSRLGLDGSDIHRAEAISECTRVMSYMSSDYILRTLQERPTIPNLVSHLLILQNTSVDNPFTPQAIHRMDIDSGGICESRANRHLCWRQRPGVADET